MQKQTYSYHKLSSIIAQANHDPKIGFSESDSFYIQEHNDNEMYIEPIFSVQDTSTEITNVEDASIILISATGATGKTALANSLSAKYHLPILNLAKHSAVASDSMTGLLSKRYGTANLSAVLESITQGKLTIIVDGLDEGLSKSGADGFFSFIDNIIELASKTNGVSFVLTGRNNVMNNVTKKLKEQKIKTALLQIEPFTVDQARNFIDQSVFGESADRFNESYKKLRDYIISSIEGFFKDESEISKKQYQRFLGYAPVLIAISRLLSQKPNYYKLLNELEVKNSHNVELIVDIVESILLREKEEKVDKLFLPTLLEDRDTTFSKEIYLHAYDINEQCCRLLLQQCGDTYQANISSDAIFNQKYEEQIVSWFDEHPFMNEKKEIQNIVFQSYVFSKMIDNEQLMPYAILYAQQIHLDSYILFDIFKTTHKDININFEIIPFLDTSIHALDKKEDIASLEIYENNITKDFTTCDVEFNIANNNTTYQTRINNTDYLQLPHVISNLIIEAPINVSFSSPKMRINAPVLIECNNINIFSKEIIFTSSNEERIILTCKQLMYDYSSGEIALRGDNLQENLELFCENAVIFPLSKYKKGGYLPKNTDSINSDLYIKLRRALIQFCSHSKGQLAKYKAKIDNRIGSTKEGKIVIESLVNEGILKQDEKMYYINNEMLAEKLGVKYSDIRSSRITPEIESFLGKIQKKILS